jgi:phage shock protein A
VAATIIFIMGICFTVYIKFFTPAVDLVQINPEYAQQQAHYVSLVETKRSELKAITKADPQLYEEMNKEFTRMDSVYRHLKKELPDSPDREKVLRAMIQNLQIQTSILNQQLNMVEQYNKMKSAQKNEIKDI